MKVTQSLILAAMALSAGMAQAGTLRCEETEKSKSEYRYEGSLEIYFSDDTKTLFFEIFDEDGKTVQDGTADLDEEFKRRNQLRYVDYESRIVSSDNEAAIFLDRTLLEGRPGRLIVTANQPNEGDSGPAKLWYTAGEFDCE